MAKRIAILGSTGSIGTSALKVIDSLNSQGGQQYEIVALSAHSKYELLAEQVKKYKPKFAAITDADFAGQLNGLTKGLGAEILAGAEGLIKIAELEEIDIVLTAVVGAAGLGAVLEAAKRGKRIAIANKEPLVIAGELLTAAAKQSGLERQAFQRIMRRYAIHSADFKNK